MTKSMRRPTIALLLVAGVLAATAPAEPSGPQSADALAGLRRSARQGDLDAIVSYGALNGGFPHRTVKELLDLAIDGNHKELVRYFVVLLPETEFRCSDTTYLHKVAAILDEASVKQLLERKAAVDALDIIDYTPLDTAICALHAESTEADKAACVRIVKLLLDHGATVDFYKLPDGWRYNPAIPKTNNALFKVVRKDTYARILEANYPPLTDLVMPKAGPLQP